MVAYEEEDNKTNKGPSYWAKGLGFTGADALKWRERARVLRYRSALRDYIHKIDMTERNEKENEYRNN
jgi:hypothetical protein